MKAGELIFWFFHPHLFIRKHIIDYRKKRAIKKAIKRSLQIPNKNICVVQVGRHFEVGTREEMHRFNKNGRKNLSRISDTSSLDFNCKHSIIFAARNGVEQI